MTSFNNTKIAFRSKTDLQLKYSYRLFKLVGNNTLVKIGPLFLALALKLRLPIISIIKKTIFKHFCGGENIKDCEKTINELHQSNVGTILDYSVEGKERKEDFERVRIEIIKTIKRAKDDLKIPFAVFKVSGLCNLFLLEKISNKSSLTENEKVEKEKLFERVTEICQNAYDNNVRVFIDAEESWIQDAIDDIARKMMEKFNLNQAIVYNTLQMYRWDRISYLKECYAEAERNEYILGIKIVRGAYLEKENLRAEKMGYNSPIHKTKLGSDKDYDLSLNYCLKHIDRIAICAGTHNEKSSLLLINKMEELKIPKNHPHIYFSQLLGMSDHISFNLSSSGYNVAKYVPYGPVKDVIPYLIRRAQENTSIAGQTSRELSLIKSEITRRKK